MATRPQHLVALDRANVVRLARAELKRAIRNREVLVAEVLLGDIPDWLEQMRVEELVLTIPRFPLREFERLMATTKAKLTQVVGGLGDRRRYFLAIAIAEWEWSRRKKAARR